MKVHFILHESFEIPGAYLTWAQSRGHDIGITKVYKEEALPQTVSEVLNLLMKIKNISLIIIQKKKLDSFDKQ